MNTLASRESTSNSIATAAHEFFSRSLLRIPHKCQGDLYCCRGLPYRFLISAWQPESIWHAPLMFQALKSWSFKARGCSGAPNAPKIPNSSEIRGSVGPPKFRSSYIPTFRSSEPYSALSFRVSKGARVNFGRNPWTISDDPSIRKYRSFEITEGRSQSQPTEFRRQSSLEIQTERQRINCPYIFLRGGF